MLTSISPLGERARGNRWWLTVTLLAAGTTAGGAALGAVLGTVGQLLPGTGEDEVRLLVMAMAGVGAAAWDLAGRPFPVRRQVNEDWLSFFRPWVYGLGYGLQLGAAVPTVVSTALVPMFMLAALLTGDPRVGLAIGMAFGLVRGLTVTMNRRVRTVDDLRTLHRRLELAGDRVRRLGALAAGLLAGAAVLGLAV